jgi:hypothetical protein
MYHVLQIEEPRKALFLYGNKTSQLIKDVIRDLHKLKGVCMLMCLFASFYVFNYVLCMCIPQMLIDLHNHCMWLLKEYLGCRSDFRYYLASSCVVNHHAQAIVYCAWIPFVCSMFIVCCSIDLLTMHKSHKYERHVSYAPQGTTGSVLYDSTL